MAYSVFIKRKAVYFRHKGYSIIEIERLTSVSKSTLSGWLRDIKISKQGKSRLNQRIIRGRERGIHQINAQYKKKLKYLRDEAYNRVKGVTPGRGYELIYTGLLFWCEGEKITTGVRFANSDPRMIVFFLKMFRQAFQLDEKKFRVLLHLHQYHNDSDELLFWQKITNIPKEQFLKIYRKDNSGKSKKYGYHGCVSLRYHDAQIAKILLFAINSLTEGA